MMASLTGRLEGDPESGCIWIGGPPKTGAGGGPISIVWPRGYEVRRDPFRLVGPDGQVVAQPGDHLRMAGGSAPAHLPVDCKVGESVFVVNPYVDIEVLTPGPQSTPLSPCEGGPDRSTRAPTAPPPPGQGEEVCYGTGPTSTFHDPHRQAPVDPASEGSRQS
ncbi:MAG: hypothetical protein M3O70_10760 [Actinomycetota bacterium]|nr:hypothetical protein [Actinomycetota bacterium]